MYMSYRILFLISAFDGIVARKLNQTSIFGAWVSTDKFHFKNVCQASTFVVVLD